MSAFDRRAIIGVLIVILLLVSNDTNADPPYKTKGTCDGLPRVDLTAVPGYCVGLVRDDLFFPRGVAVLKDGRVLVADMGGWNRNRGSVWVLQRRGKSFSKRKLLGRLDRPHGIAIGPDGRAYVAACPRAKRSS
jgi:NHL repeat